MGAQNNTRTIEHLYAAFGAGDVPAALEPLDDRVQFHIGGTSPIAGHRVGTDAGTALGAAVLAETDSTLRTELLELLANETYVDRRRSLG